jgi:RimJ/RimL family protein N-acetyltransferase
MIKLSSDFELDRYGLHVRLVREEDAEFIVRLRTNERNARFIHATDGNVEKQVEWIKQYKVREANGEDYYFIFYSQEHPVGLIRIYDIDYEAKKATAGSWVCEPDLPMQIPISILIICREILFDVLGMEKDCFDVRKGNKHVQRVHKMMGAEIVAEDELNYYFELPKEVFEEKKHEIINLLNIG